MIKDSAKKMFDDKLVITVNDKDGTKTISLPHTIRIAIILHRGYKESACAR